MFDLHRIISIAKLPPDFVAHVCKAVEDKLLTREEARELVEDELERRATESAT